MPVGPIHSLRDGASQPEAARSIEGKPTWENKTERWSLRRESYDRAVKMNEIWEETDKKRKGASEGKIER